MARERSGRVSRQIHQLFRLGAVGTLSDAQLLDLFRLGRDADAAFEELVFRHGPMVLRTCRGVLRDSHDAEDAFQAVFLVLATRSGSIRRGQSVASWLFGVAQRVAAHARRGAARRRLRERRVAEQTPEAHVPEPADPDREILHEEIGHLPERLRAPIVLCYLQGLSCDAAAHRLGVSDQAVRGRLARARARLRRRLLSRGIAEPAGAIAALAADRVPAAIPAPLLYFTIPHTPGFAASSVAASLARGVMNAMLRKQLRIAVRQGGLDNLTHGPSRYRSGSCRTPSP